MSPASLRFVAVSVIALGGCTPSPLVTAPTVTSATAPEPPAGVARTVDADITAALARALSGDRALSGAVVHVSTWQGIVELSGTTPSLLARERATLHAEMLRGVRSVVDRLVVEHTRVADGGLARDVRQALEDDPATASAELRVEARDGVVRIYGRTRSLTERELASTVARSVRGVREVRSEIDVVGGTPRSDREVSLVIRSRLRWDAFVDAGGLTVRCENGVVTIAGAVASAAEKRRAITDTWIAGVTEVDASELHVDPWLRTNDRPRDDAVPTPAAVERALRDALIVDPRVDTAGAHVSFARGVATLGGTVRTLAARNAAAQVARDTVGVRAVANLLSVSAHGSPSDLEIERRAAAALARSSYTEGRGVVASVVDGTATLSGDVDSIFTKAEAESVVASVWGVRAIDNRLTVHDASRAYTTNRYLVPYGRSAALEVAAPAPTTKTDSAIQTDFSSRLVATPFVDPSEIQARVFAGRVVLTGRVPSWRAWLAASDAAWDAGASAVENRLLIR